MKEPKIIINTETKDELKNKFKESWFDLKNKKYRPWAERPTINKNSKVHIRCSWCKKEFLVGSLYGKTGHLQQQTNLDKEAEYLKTESKENGNMESLDDKAKKLKLFEYELCNLMVNLNLPLQDVEPLLNFTKKYISRTSVIKESKINRHKASDIIINEIQFYLKENLEASLVKYPFSIMLDESSDLSKKKFLAIMTQYFDPNQGVITQLHSFKECSIDASADALFKIVKDNILDKGFSKNLIGYVSDGAPVMNGPYNSVLSRLHEYYPKIWYLYCMTHALHLVACKASSAIPVDVEKFVKKTFKFFKNSPKRVAQSNDLIENMQLDVKKLLKPVVTRWLSIQQAVERLLVMWDPLYKYFEEVNEDELVSAMQGKEVKIYLQFQSIFLKKFT